jgi:methyl-accepting chemotaxis protein
MTKIKFLAVLIFILALTLAYFSKYASMENERYAQTLKTLNEQKAFTQEISKNIFYMYNNTEKKTDDLDTLIKNFVANMNQRDDGFEESFSKNIQKQHKKILKEWNEFYLLVQKFRDLYKVNNNAYTNMALKELVNEIYHTNARLIMSLNKLIALHKNSFEEFLVFSKVVHIFLYILLIFSLIYFFTQLKHIIAFIQRFVQRSKNIVTRKSVKGIEPIEKEICSDTEMLRAVDNFNRLVQKINDSIDFSSQSIEKASKSLEEIENNIEELLDFMSSVDSERVYDKEMIKKEDILIDALDELSSSIQKLQKLKINLETFKNKE